MIVVGVVDKVDEDGKLDVKVSEMIGVGEDVMTVYRMR